MPGSGNYNWAGFLSTSKLPHSFNPAEGFVATANHKMIPEHYPYKVGFEWEPRYRFERIRSVIENAHRAKHKLTLADIALVAYTRWAHEGGFDLARHPHVRDWVLRIETDLGLAHAA